MRLAGQEKCGFYPAPDDAIEALATHLQVVPPYEKRQTHILDPCAGKGAAIRLLGERLGVPPSQTFAVELDAQRGEAARLAMPTANILSPCSFFTSSIQGFAFGLIYCNPPFDDEFGGGQREELTFVRECHHLLCSEGILALVLPWQSLKNRDLMMHLDTHYRDAAVFRFPQQQYREVVFIGVKRSVSWPVEKAHTEGLLHDKMRLGKYHYAGTTETSLATLGTPSDVWDEGRRHVGETIERWSVPPTWRPTRWLKAGYLDGELEQRLASSQLNRMFELAEQPVVRQPPLPLVAGQVGLLLAAGTLNGRIELPGSPPHVFRGISSKSEFLNEEASETTVSEDGKTMRIKEVWSQQINLEGRAVEQDGVIHSFQSSKRVGEDRVVEREELCA